MQHAIRPRVCVGYVRASTTEQRDTIATQIDALMREARHRGFSLTGDDIFADEGISGGTPFYERPAVARMLARAEQTGARVLLVSKVDRAFRDMADCGTTVRQLHSRGWSLRFLDFFGQELDLTTAMGQLILGIAVLVAQFERQRIAERITENARAKKARGELTGQVPYGADRVPSSRKTKNLDPGRVARYGDTAFDLVPNPAEQNVLARLRSGDLERVSDNEAARRLNFEGIPAKKGGCWHGATVRSARRHGWTPSTPTNATR